MYTKNSDQHCERGHQCCWSCQQAQYQCQPDKEFSATGVGDVLVEAAIAGAGVTLQPSFISGSAIRNGQLHVILPDHEPDPMGLYAVYAHRQLLASKVRCFVDFMDGYFGDPPYWDRFD